MESKWWFPALALWRLLIATFLVQTFFVPDEFFQSVEVVHQFWNVDPREAERELTWEWHRALRSPLHPLLYAIWMKFLRLLSLNVDFYFGARLLQGFLAVWADWATVSLYRRLGINSSSQRTMASCFCHELLARNGFDLCCFYWICKIWFPVSDLRNIEPLYVDIHPVYLLVSHLCFNTNTSQHTWNGPDSGRASILALGLYIIRRHASKSLSMGGHRRLFPSDGPFDLAALISFVDCGFMEAFFSRKRKTSSQVTSILVASRVGCSVDRVCPSTLHKMSDDRLNFCFMKNFGIDAINNTGLLVVWTLDGGTLEFFAFQRTGRDCFLLRRTPMALVLVSRRSPFDDDVVTSVLVWHAKGMVEPRAPKSSFPSTPLARSTLAVNRH